MSSNKAGRVLVAVALAAALGLAVPVEAFDGRGAQLGLLERLTAWFVETWMTSTEEPQADDASTSPTTPTEDEDDPEGCRDYSACVDPNG